MDELQNQQQEQPTPTLENDFQKADSTPIEHDASSGNSNTMSVWVMILVLVLIFMVGAVFVFVLLNRPKETNESDMTPNVDRIVESGKIIVGVDATFPPMESMNDNGDIVGFDIDFATKIAEDLSVELELKVLEWDLIFDALLDGEIDIIISSVTITEERKELYAFSDQYINAGQVILTRADNTSITSVSDLADEPSDPNPKLRIFRSVVVLIIYLFVFAMLG